MKSTRRFKTLFLLAMTLTAAGASAQRVLHQEFRAPVQYVEDGDTVAVTGPDGKRLSVRLANIDAPERDHGRCKPGQPFAQQSRDRLAQLVQGREVLFRCSTLDRYDRHVCDLHIGATTANREMAMSGHAWANRANPSYLRDAEVARLEAQARREGKGLWSDGKPVEPWEWRHTIWAQACNNSIR